MESFAGYKDWVPMHDVHDIQDPAWSSYVPTMERYALQNLDVATLLADARTAADWCYGKCARDQCVGDYCYCDGFYSGYDTDAVPSLCAPKTRCMALCDALGENCTGVDTHMTLPRCFLNGPGANATELVYTKYYAHLAKGKQYADRGYSPVTGTLCTGRNIAATTPGPAYAKVRAHSCYAKCADPPWDVVQTDHPEVASCPWTHTLSGCPTGNFRKPIRR